MSNPDRRKRIIEGLEGLLQRMRSGEEEVWAEYLNPEHIPTELMNRELVLAHLLLGYNRRLVDEGGHHVQVDRAGWAALGAAAAKIGCDRVRVLEVLGEHVQHWAKADHVDFVNWYAGNLKASGRIGPRFGRPRMDRWAYSLLLTNVANRSFQRAVFSLRPWEVADIDVDTYSAVEFAVGDPAVLRAAVAAAQSPAQRRGRTRGQAAVATA